MQEVILESESATDHILAQTSSRGDDLSPSETLLTCGCRRCEQEPPMVNAVYGKGVDDSCLRTWLGLGTLHD